MTETVQQDEWTEQNCINLIEEFRKRIMLWDPKHPLYFKKQVKNEMWQEISEAIGIPPKACRHKMIVLMSSFRREKFKILQSLRAQTSSPDSPAKKPYVSSWFAFRRLMFLLDKTANCENDLNDKDVETLKKEGRMIKAALIENSVDSPVYKKKKNNNGEIVYVIQTDDAVDRVINGMTPEETIVHMDESSDDEVLINPSVDLAPANSPLPLPITETDEITSFVSFIASKMRKYSEETKNEVQAKICEIIFRADKKKNVKTYPTPQTSKASFAVPETDYPNLFSAQESDY